MVCQGIMSISFFFLRRFSGQGESFIIIYHSILCWKSCVFWVTNFLCILESALRKYDLLSETSSLLLKSSAVFVDLLKENWRRLLFMTNCQIGRRLMVEWFDEARLHFRDIESSHLTYLVWINIQNKQKRKKSAATSARIKTNPKD